MSILQSIPGRSPEALLGQGPAEDGVCHRERCRFCGLQHGLPDLFVELHGDVPYLPIPGVPDSLMAMLCAFPIAHRGGHLLIVPREHYLSFAQFPHQHDLHRALEIVRGTLENMFPDHWLFVFEHGAGAIDGQPVGCGGCHVDHAHGHVMVLDRSVTFEDIRTLTEDTLDELGWDRDGQARATAGPWVDLAPVCGEHPYLHIGALKSGGEGVIYTQVSQSQSVPSQLLRRLVATAAGRPSPSYWNWKIALQHNLVRRLEEYTRDALGFKKAVREYVGSGE